MVKLQVANTQSEIEEAFELAFDVFKNSISENNYYSHKSNLWLDDPSFSYDNFFLAKNESEIIGLIRAVPRVFKLNTDIVNVFGISSVCVSNQWRGKGVSLSLMNFAHEKAKERKFDFALLFARRAVDHFYNKFGYFGISSYSKVKINIKENYNNNGFFLDSFSIDYWQTYQEAFSNSYKNYLFKALREESFWHFINKTLIRKRQIQFNTILFNQDPIGYIVYSNFTIHEFALVDGYNQIEILEIIAKEKSLIKDGVVDIEVSLSHEVNKALYNYDYTRSVRHCAYGGHMLKSLKEINRLDNSLNHYSVDSSYLGLLSCFNNFSDYSDNHNISKCIDIPLLDHF